MTRYLLGTNIISHQSLLEWLADQADDTLFISSLSLAEIGRGILKKPSGKKRRELDDWFSGPQALFRGRVQAFDERAALVWGRLMSEGTAAGPRCALDMVVAAIAEASDCLLVNDNEKHFSGVVVVNPLSPGRGKA